MKKMILISTMALMGISSVITSVKYNALQSDYNSMMESCNEYETIVLDELNSIESSAEIGFVEFYSSLADENCIEIVDTVDLTAEILENRNCKLIIEKCIGTVISEDGDGEILGLSDYNYISYSGIDCEVGDTVCSLFIYDTNNNCIDTIVDRYDYVVDTVE